LAGFRDYDAWFSRQAVTSIFDQPPPPDLSGVEFQLLGFPRGNTTVQDQVVTTEFSLRSGEH